MAIAKAASEWLQHSCNAFELHLSCCNTFELQDSCNIVVVSPPPTLPLYRSLHPPQFTQFNGICKIRDQACENHSCTACTAIVLQQMHNNNSTETLALLHKDTCHPCKFPHHIFPPRFKNDMNHAIKISLVTELLFVMSSINLFEI